MFWHNKLNVGELDQCLRVLWSQKQGQDSGRSKSKDKRVRLYGAAIARPWSQNPKGRRFIPVLLKQGLMLLPLSLDILGKTTSFKTQI